MTEEEQAQMTRFGITVAQKRVYSYKGYKYDHLKDALNYAKIDTERQKAANTASG